jgi:hypothetical protein
MAKQLHDADFAGLFGIDMAGDTASFVAPNVSGILCVKCKGRGNFISHTGRIVGQCFACNGTGFERAAITTVRPGDCDKCIGTGEWRPGKPCFACNGTGKPVVATVVTVEQIERSFAAAREHGIKRPKLRLDTFIFARAPDTGRNAGSIYVTQDEVYLGKVTGGQFAPTRDCDTATTARIVTAAGDPDAAARAYGLRTGVCSCCGRGLTNGESIALGIGPICRGKFGWGG